MRGGFQLAVNFRRAAELTGVPDEEVLRSYNALRPNQSTKWDLLAIATEFEKRYKARMNAGFIREAIDVYERRNLLKKDNLVKGPDSVIPAKAGNRRLMFIIHKRLKLLDSVSSTE